MNRMVVSGHVRIHRQRQRSERPALLLGRCSQSSCTREPDTAPFNFFHQFQRIKARTTTQGLRRWRGEGGGPAIPLRARSFLSDGGKEESPTYSTDTNPQTAAQRPCAAIARANGRTSEAVRAHARAQQSLR